jgi:L-seryl-tRNA(Ser) seleniumtransferase
MHVHPDLWVPPLADGCPSAIMHEPPHQGIGRSFKVGREELAGLIAALEALADRDPEAERRRWHSICASVADAVEGVGGATASVVSLAPPAYPRTIVQLPPTERAHQIIGALAAGRPRIWVGGDGGAQRRDRHRAE